MTCRRCRARQHLECWRFAGGCATYGCQGRIYLRGDAAAPSPTGAPEALVLRGPSLMDSRQARQLAVLGMAMSVVLLTNAPALFGLADAVTPVTLLLALLIPCLGVAALGECRRRSEVTGGLIRSNLQLGRWRIPLGGIEASEREVLGLLLQPSRRDPARRELVALLEGGRRLVLADAGASDLDRLETQAEAIAEVLGTIIEWAETPAGLPGRGPRALPGPGGE